jgi:hypothetical protein
MMLMCCGKTIAKINTIRKIAQGNLIAMVGMVAPLPPAINNMSVQRIAVCQDCDEHTWITEEEFFSWLKANTEAVVKNLDDLTVLPPLEKKEKREATDLCCVLCKCYITAKSYVKDSKCPLNKWDN